MDTTIEVGNVWSNQTVDVWELLSGEWRVYRRGFSLWNYMGSFRTHPRLAKDAYLFPSGFNPREFVS